MVALLSGTIFRLWPDGDLALRESPFSLGLDAKRGGAKGGKGEEKATFQREDI